MSLLVIQIPPKPRLRARALRHAADGAAVPAPGPAFDFVWSEDGRQIGRHGHDEPSRMPTADSVVAVIPESDLSWHSLTIPKAPPNRMRAALGGMLEDALLEDAAHAHFSLAAQARPGEAGMVAVTDRRWLAAALAAIEGVGLAIDRIVPVAWPQQPPLGHFSASAAADDEQIRLCWADAAGVASFELQRGAIARALLPQPLPPEVRFSATPMAAAQAEAWLGAPVALQSAHERALHAATASPWDMRQFEFVRRHRGSRALRDIGRALLGPAWRPVRVGLVALVLVQLVGLNLAAWQMRDEQRDKQARMVSLLQSTFPHVTGVLDAPLQMRREIEQLRARAGRPGEDDLEPLLYAAAAAWPPGRPPVPSVSFEPGRLSLSAADWRPDEVDAFRDRLQAVGYTAVLAEGRVQVRRAPRAGAA